MKNKTKLIKLILGSICFIIALIAFFKNDIKIMAMFMGISILYRLDALDCNK